MTQIYAINKITKINGINEITKINEESYSEVDALKWVKKQAKEIAFMKSGNPTSQYRPKIMVWMFSSIKT